MLLPYCMYVIKYSLIEQDGSKLDDLTHFFQEISQFL